MIRIELLSKENFTIDSLDNYIRKQDVKRVYRKKNGEYSLVECSYTEDWDMEKRRSVAKDISKKEYITYLALDGDRVVGFIGLIKKTKWFIYDSRFDASICRSSRAWNRQKTV